RVWTNTIDHPCLATGGTGDVLAGVIGGLVSQFVPSTQQMLFKTKVPAMPMPEGRPLDLFEAAQVGVFAHGLAARIWAYMSRSDAGLLAPKLATLIPRALQAVRTPFKPD